MDQIQACRTCLATDVRLNNINKNHLNLLLEDALQVENAPDDGLPQFLCSLCAALLMKYDKFRQRCMYAQNLLMDISFKNMLTTDYLRQLDFDGKPLTQTLSIQNNNKITNIIYDDPEIKQEILPVEETINDNICKEEVFSFESQMVNAKHKIEFTEGDTSANEMSLDDDDDDDNDDVSLNYIKHMNDKHLRPERSKCKVKVATLDIIKKETSLDSKQDKVSGRKLQPRRNALAPKKVNDGKKKPTKVNAAKPETTTKKSKKPNLNDEVYFAKLLVENKVELKKLSTQEQIDEVQARKTSLNYMSSVFKCDQCFLGFWKEATYINHMNKHDPSIGSFVCEVCKMYYGSIGKLTKHVKVVHGERYSCKLCDYVSVNWGQAKHHYNFHKGVLFKCKKCDKEFKIQSTYYTHMRVSHPSEHVCDICGATFLSSRGLRFHHQRSHKGEEPTNNCKDCGLYFKGDAAFDRHMATASVHNGDGGNFCHYCNHCGDSFRTNSELKTHLHEHKKSDKTDLITCELCKKVFKVARHYTSHYQRYHQSEALSALQAGAVPARSRKTSRKLVEAQALVCELCGKKYTNVTHFKYHKRIHTGEKPHACKHCPKRFRINTLLQLHERTHTGERPYKCPICPKAFGSKGAYNAHSRVHSGIKPYQCTHCGKAFSQWSTHKLHVTTVHFKLPAPYKKKNKAKQLVE